MPYVIIAIAVIILGIIVFPLINRYQFKKMPAEQQVRILMKQAKGLIFFKNISYGKEGKLVYIKNKRKIYIYPWVLKDGNMLCTRSDLYESWDYPEEYTLTNPEFRWNVYAPTSDAYKAGLPFLLISLLYIRWTEFKHSA